MPIIAHTVQGHELKGLKSMRDRRGAIVLQQRKKVWRQCRDLQSTIFDKIITVFDALQAYCFGINI